MGAGLLQLVCKGQQDTFLCENPNMSFFKYSYRKHTKFAIENIQLEFNNTPLLNPNIVDGQYTCKITRNGDLLKNLYFCFSLPEVYSSKKHSFKWVKNIGHNIIKKCIVKVDGLVIDTITNDWLNIWNELTIDKMGYDDLIGNIPSITNPTLFKKKLIIDNNKFIYDYYPYSDKNDPNCLPSIKKTQIRVPLPFWFTRNPSLALPLLRLQANEITLTITLENSEHLYTVINNEIDKDISPLLHNKLYNENININTFVKNNFIFPYIEAEYVFLDNNERNTIFRKTNLQYLVEQLEITPQNIISINNNPNNNTIIKVNTNKPTKELIWIMRRDDYLKNFNDYTNYTASFHNNNQYPILNRASILWDKSKIIVNEKDNIFYNKIQPYQYHTKIPNMEGLYLYSFALNPEKNNPSGYYNASLVDSKISIYINNYQHNDPLFNLDNLDNLKRILKNEESYKIQNYFVDIFSVTYNIFEIIGRSAGMKFA